jgi:hypothetical protein
MSVPTVIKKLCAIPTLPTKPGAHRTIPYPQELTNWHTCTIRGMGQRQMGYDDRTRFALAHA